MIQETERGIVEGKESEQRLILIAIEGPVCAGKTTLINSLLPLGFPKIPEYVDYAIDNSVRLPKFPPQTEEEAKTSFNFYLELEIKRQQGIPLRRTVLLDRSIFTLLAFEAGARRLTGIDIFDWATNQVVSKQAELMIPDRTLYIDVPPEESRRRAILAEMHTPDFLFSQEFFFGFREAFKTFQLKYPNKITFIDGCRSQPELIREVLLFLLAGESASTSDLRAGTNPSPGAILR